MNVKDFIEVALINDIKSIQQTGHHYHSFSLISQSIEFLGACIDRFDFGERGQSENRFELAIKRLFPSNYHVYNRRNSMYYLYRNLRCGLLHKMIPNSRLELIQRAEILSYGNHLEIENIRNIDRLILVSQDFYSDFKKASLEVMQRIDNNEIGHNKVYQEFLSTEP